MAGYDEALARLLYLTWLFEPANMNRVDYSESEDPEILFIIQKAFLDYSFFGNYMSISC